MAWNEEKKPNSNEIKRIRTEIIGLDNIMQGGVPEGFIVLICGNSGTMKSSVGFSILYNAFKKQKKKGMYLTLEQSKESVKTHMKGLDMPLKGMTNPVVVDLAKVRKDMDQSKEDKKIDWLTSILKVIRKYKDTFGCEILVFDSLAALYALNQFDNPRNDLFYFFEGLRDVGLTTFLISEIPQGEEVFGIYGVEDFLSDGILHLKPVETERGMNLYLRIVKMRQTRHKRKPMPLLFEDGRFEVIKE